MESSKSDDLFSNELPDFEVCGSLLRELFKDFDSETDTDERSSENILPMSESGKTGPCIKRKSNIYEEIEKFQKSQVAKNTVR